MTTSISRASVTVVIPAFNEQANIAQITRQILDEPWTDTCALDEIIIVDDCSEDATPQVAAHLSSEHDRVRVLRQEQRSGKNKGIRVAAATCESDVIAVVDADVSLTRGCLIKTIRLLRDDPSLMASSCLIEPLPARSWRERASHSQALLVAELKRLGYAYLSAIYVVKRAAIGALDIPDNVADDAYITRWLRGHDYHYAVFTDTAAYIRAATGLHDFAKQTLRGRRGEAVTKQALCTSTTLVGRRKVLPLALMRAFVRDPLGLLLYITWYIIVLIAPTRLWTTSIGISTFEASTSTKDLGL